MKVRIQYLDTIDAQKGSLEFDEKKDLYKKVKHFKNINDIMSKMISKNQLNGKQNSRYDSLISRKIKQRR